MILLLILVETTNSYAEEGLRFSLLQDTELSFEDGSLTLLTGSDDTSQKDKEKVELALKRYYEESKNPAIGFMLGLFVGFGTGHYYTGDIKTGIIVTVWETISLPFFLNSILYYAAWKNDIGDRYLRTGIAIAYSAVLFDAIHSIFVIKKYNRNLMKKIIEEYEIDPSVFYSEGRLFAGLTLRY